MSNTPSNTTISNENLVQNTVTVIRKPIKHLYLRVYKDNRIVVSAPKHLSEQAVNDFIAEKSAWITQKQRQYQDNALTNTENHQTSTRTAAGWQIDKTGLPISMTLWGKTYTVSLESSTSNRLCLNTETANAVLQLTPKSTPIQREKVLIEYYRRQLMPIVQNFVTHYQKLIGVSVSEIRSKQMKTKWGTCNTRDKRLWFNVQLARYAVSCTEYVVVHEMVHLHERYHNQRFYRLVAQAMPDWQRWHEQLKHV